MFDPEFFPSPPEVIDRMVGGMHLDGVTVYEPSAGSGNIADYCADRGANVICAEKVGKLRNILEKRHDVISDDHFTVKSEDVSHVDMIIMNPPFSNAAEHILHAYEIAPGGCDIIALCNKNTTTNLHTSDRKKLNYLIENYGSVEHLGSCFDTSERTTGVKVALIRLKTFGERSKDFEDVFSQEADEAWGGQEGMLPYNAIRDIVQRYKKATFEIKRLVKVSSDLNRLVGEMGLNEITFHVAEDGTLKKSNDLIKKLQKNAWQHVFKKMNMGKYITQDARDQVNAFVETQEHVPFTVRNVYRMMEVIVGTHDSRMDKALITVFDRLTQHYHDNRYSVEGWKTNSNYLIGKKFILPWMTEKSINGCMKFPYRGNVNKIEDFVKAINHITGDRKEFNRWDWFKNPEFGEKYDLAYWEVRGYKKGTMHFVWKDMKVWELVNRRIAEVRGWELPEKL